MCCVLAHDDHVPMLRIWRLITLLKHSFVVTQVIYAAYTSAVTAPSQAAAALPSPLAAHLLDATEALTDELAARIVAADRHYSTPGLLTA